MPTTPPISNGSNGRDSGGRFASGNAGGPGNPHAAAVKRLRTALLKATTPTEIIAVMKRMIREAKAGNVAAAHLVFDRAIGKPLEQPDLIERIEELEKTRLTPRKQ